MLRGIDTKIREIGSCERQDDAKIIAQLILPKPEQEISHLFRPEQG